MKKFIPFFLFISLLFAEMPFNKGVNLTQWFEVNNIRKVNFTKFTKQDFINIKSLGCDVIRLPMRMNDFTDGAPDYTIDPLYFFFLDQVLDWAEELELNLILDNHTFSAAVDTDSETTDPLVPVWQQISERYKTRSELIYYEVLNEPHNCDDSLWYEIQGNVIDAIREIDSKHTIIVGGANWNTYSDLNQMPIYEDDNLIYTFHFYDPFIFTHQGATWGDPSLGNLAGVPFPYNESEMPAIPPDLAGTWVESSFNNYSNDGNWEKVKELLDIAINFQDTSGIQTYCGELGVLMNNADDDDRTNWYGLVTSYLSEHNIPWTTWDYQGIFGLFEKGSNQLFNYDLNIPLLEALGFSVPVQKDYQLHPDSSEFSLYTDFLEKNIIMDHWSYEVENINLFYDENVYNGTYCIRWTDQSRYSGIVMDFHPDKDLSYLKDQGYQIDFYVKSNVPNLKFDLRFLDSVTDIPEDLPWRMRYTIDNHVVDWNGEWQHVQIPLADFSEHGSWYNNAWHDPQGLFDWSAINYLEIALEHMDLMGKKVYFDDIKIVKPASIYSADFSADVISGSPPLSVNFSDQSTGDINSWVWDFGDGDSGNEQNPSHTYENAGDFSVSLTVSGPDGSDSIVKTDYISVNYAKPEAEFSVDITEGTAPLTVQFTNNTNGEVNTWRWNFGDGTTSDEAVPAHTYEEAGIYTISLTATGPGGRDTEVKNDYITVTSETAVVEDNLPTEYCLYPNYPNPFNPTTMFSYSVPKNCHVNLSVFNNNGEITEELVNKVHPAGNYAIQWNASEHPSGIYFFKIVTPDFTDIKKCSLIK